LERLRVENLHKYFGRNKVLKGVSFTVGEGEIIAVLGPNASGKSTLIKCILGLVIPTKGRIFVMGEDVRKGVEYRSRVGYMPQIARFPENLTVGELLSLVEDVRGRKASADRYIELFSLQPFLDKPLGILSGGTRQKVNATLSFMFDNDVYILDEPTVGFDPVASTHFKDEVLHLRDSSKTVLFTSHIMSEVEELADRVIFLLNGVIHFDGSPLQLKSNTGERTLERAIARLMREVEIENGS